MLNASIVLYNHSLSQVKPLVTSLRGASCVDKVYLVDNSPRRNAHFERLAGVHYIFNGANVGYGAAHNIALRETMTQKQPYHLVINPDIEMDSAVLDALIDYMERHPDVGHLMPKVRYPTGQTQYLCKLLPTPVDLLARRFLPSGWSMKSRHRFELRYSGYDAVMEVPYLSGCFMLLKRAALEEVGLFDERFFMYPEDIDLTRRIHRKYKTVFYPHVSVVHRHEQGSYKNGRLLFVHLWNIIKYFNKWGWFFDAERKQINDAVRKKLKQ